MTVEIEKLQKELNETRLAAIFSAVELLHKLGVSGSDAEKIWCGDHMIEDMTDVSLRLVEGTVIREAR